MTRIAIGVFVLGLVCRPSWAAQPPDPETSSRGVDIEANRSDPSEDQPPHEPLGAAAMGDAAALMASTHWFTAAILVAGLTSSALGQAVPPSTSPFRDSIAREATRLAGRTAEAPGAAARWSRVRSLRPGELIDVTLSAGPTLRRLFLAADDTAITVLNDSNPMLPEDARRSLRRLAAADPRALLIVAKGGTIRLDRLRIDRRGAFLDGSRIADVSSIVELYSQDGVEKIVLAEWRAPKRLWQYLLGWPGLIGLSVGVGVSAQLGDGKSRYRRP